MLVEQPDEGAYGAGGVVVLRLSEQQGAATLDVPQIDVVPQRGTEDASLSIADEYDLRLRVVPGRIGTHADPVAPADR